MNTVDRKGRAVLVPLMLAGGGVAVGALASSLTTDSLVWRAPAQVLRVDAPATTAIDQAGAGQNWARTAFDGGLRQCPRMNDAFLASCEAEMKKLAERPALLAGSYGGPLLITKVERVADDRSWKAQDRLETPRYEPDTARYAPPADPLPDDPTFEPTPDNYPAMVETDPPQEE